VYFISEACLDVLLFELWFVIGNLLPQKAVVILVVDSDAACSGFNGHCAWKSVLLVLVWCCTAKGGREPDLWGYWLPECCIKQCYDKPAGDGCLQEVWAGGAMKYANKGFRKHSWFTPLTRLSIHIADTSPLLLQYLWSVSIFSGRCIIYILVANRMSSCSELNPWHNIHILVWILLTSYLSVLWLLQL
jgi:hypothetical protein